MLDVSQYSETSSRRRLQRGPPPQPNDGGSSGGGESLSTATGIGLSGAYIYNALDGDNLDAVEQEYDTLD